MKTRWVCTPRQIALIAGLLLLVLPVVALGEDWWSTRKSDEYWLDAMTREVLLAEFKQGNLQPYLGQLQVMRAAFRHGDEATIYRAMTRFMEMLENREYGIPDGTAHWLFDYCHLITPGKFHGITGN